MKIPILVFCLTVIFGNIFCRIYSKENVDLIEGTADNENYDMNYFDVPLEKSLSRYKRASTLSPVTDLIDMIGTGSIDLTQAMLDFLKFITGLLTGQKGSCPMEKLSVEKLIEKLIGEIKNPIQAIEIIICFISNTTGEETRSITSVLLKITIKFLCTIFLPALHTILNEIAKIPILGERIEPLTKAFNAVYDLFKIIKC
ncbi:hypothetical protein CAJAP_00937 [Camponotus japonicus]